MIYPGGTAPAGSAGEIAQAYYGKYPGIVLNRVPPSDSSHHRGELEVQVPGILEEDGSGGERPLEVIARPCFPPGSFSIPEEGAPVWVEFAAGDINAPIWTGAWYPANGTPATVDGERPSEDQTVFRTPSGQVIQLEDTGGSQRLVLSDEANGNRVVLDANGVLLEAGLCSIELSGTTIRITNGTHTLEMSSTGTTLDHAGMGAEGLVLAPLLDWLLSHQHVGNMGAPTPLFPADLAMLQVPVPPKKSVP